MNASIWRRAAFALLATVTAAPALAAAPPASQLGAGTVVLLALGLAAVGLTLFLNPFGAAGFVLFALAGLGNTAFLAHSSMTDSTEGCAGSIVGFVMLIVIASYRTQDRIREIRSAEEAAFRERYDDQSMQD